MVTLVPDLHDQLGPIYTTSAYPEGLTAVLIFTPMNWNVLADCVVDADPPVDNEVLDGVASSLMA